MTEEEKIEILKLLESIPNEFRVIENQINSEKIDEYYELLEDLGTDNELKKLEEWSEIKSEEQIKKNLVLLSEIGDVKSYRKIKKMTDSKNPEIREFAFYCAENCKIEFRESIGWWTSWIYFLWIRRKRE